MNLSFMNLSANTKGAIERAAVQANVELPGFFTQAKQYILDNFGEQGLYAAYIVAAAVVIFVLSHLFKISFKIITTVVIPAIATAFIASIFLPYNFFYLLPVTASVFSVALLFRG